MTKITNRNQRGYYLIGLLIVIVILFFLYGNQLLPDKTTGKSQANYAIDRAKVSECMMNRTTLNTQVAAWSINHPGQKPSIEAFQQAGVSIPVCKAHGVYSFGDDGTVYCSIHNPMPAPAGSNGLAAPAPGTGIIPAAMQTPTPTAAPTVLE